MMSRFAQPAQGKGPRGPKAVRPAFFVIGAGIAYAQCFYAPHVRLEPVRVTAAQTVTPIRSTAEERITVKAIRGQEGPEAEARFLWAVRYLLAIANQEPIQ
jgi:hypothetical protein